MRTRLEKLCVYTFIGNVVFFMSHIALFVELIITDTNLVVARKMRYKQCVTSELTFSQQCWCRLAMPTGIYRIFGRTQRLHFHSEADQDISWTAEPESRSADPDDEGAVLCRNVGE